MLWDRTNRPLWLRCIIGILVAVIAAAIRLQFLGILELHAPFVTFYLAVAIAALYGGFVSGLLATVVSAALADYFWMEPVGQLGITNFADLLSIVVFLASGALISWLAESTYRAQARAKVIEVQAKLAAQQQFQLFVSEVKDYAIIMLDTAGCVVSWNMGAEQIKGYQTDEIIGHHHSCFYTLEDNARGWPDQLLHRAASEGRVEDEGWRVSKDGSRFWANVVVTALHDKEGSLRGFSKVTRDITERNQAEALLQRQAELLHLSYDAIIVWQLGCHIESWNKGAEELYGYSEEEAVGQVTHDLLKTIHPEPWTQIEAKLRERKFWEGELKHHTRDGREIIVSARHQLVRGADGVERVLETSRDITEKKRAEEALRQSEQRLALAASATGIGIFDSNSLTGDIAGTEQFGYLIGLQATATTTTTSLSHHYHKDQWAERVHPDDRPGLRAKIEASQSQRRPLDAEYRVADADGTERWVNVRGVFRDDDQGNATRFFGVIIDISERKRAEAAVAAAHEQIQSIIDNTPAVIYALDLEERFVLANTALAELFNSTPERMIGKKRHEFMLKEDADWHEANDRLVIEAGGALEFEEYSQLEGRSLTWLTTKFPLRDSRGRIYAVAGISADISERKQADEALRESEAKLQAALASIPDAVFISDTEGRLVNFNDGFVTYHRFRSRDECSRSIAECPIYLDAYMADGHPATPEMWALPRALRGETVNNTRYTLRRKDTGETWTGSYSFGPIRDKDCMIMGSVVVARDITEQQQMQEELRKSRDELELRVRERTAELERSNQALQDFASIASHDLQEPLRKVKAFGDMLKQKCGGSLEDHGRDYLERMLNATERMRSLLAGLLDYSRVTTKTEPFKEVDLAHLIGEVLADLEVRIVKTGGEVRVGDLPVMQADPTQMRQLFQNIIGNALKFHKTGEKPLVQIRSAPNADSGYQIIVEDNGIGFEERYLDRIFAPFQRLHGRSSQYEGTGMGLAICKKIVERHGGSITAKSVPGEGATFIINLPRKIKDTTY